MNPNTALMWTPECIAALHRVYPATPRSEAMQVLPGFGWHAIQRKAAHLGIRRTRRYVNGWTDAQIATLQTVYKKDGAQEVARLTGRSMKAVYSLMGRLGIQGRQARGTRYAEAEKNLIAALYPTATRQEVVDALPGRTWANIQKQATALGIRRPRRPKNKTRPAAKLKPKAAPKPPKPIAIPKTSPPPPRTPKPLAAKPVQPQPAPKPKALPPAGHNDKSPRLPVANAQKAAAKAAREAKKLNPPVTAEMVRELAANHPARLAWTREVRHGAEAGAAAFHQAMSQLKQAA